MSGQDDIFSKSMYLYFSRLLALRVEERHIMADFLSASAKWLVRDMYYDSEDETEESENDASVPLDLSRPSPVTTVTISARASDQREEILSQQMPNYPTVSVNVDHSAAALPLTNLTDHSIRAQFVENVGQTTDISTSIAEKFSKILSLSNPC